MPYTRYSIPMVDQGASAGVLLAELWPLDDPEKSAPWSPALHNATHQAEVAVKRLFTVHGACKLQQCYLVVAAFRMCRPNFWTIHLRSAEIQAKTLSRCLLGEPEGFLVNWVN